MIWMCFIKWLQTIAGKGVSMWVIIISWWAFLTDFCHGLVSECALDCAHECYEIRGES